ncbi:MAG: hypothetical protein ACM3PP_12090 [Candidatus Saccharibacteria bacterium]
MEKSRVRAQVDDGVMTKERKLRDWQQLISSIFDPAAFVETTSTSAAL